MKHFWILLFLAAAVVMVGWIAYGIWEWRMRKIEKEQPKQRSEKYQQATSAVSDYAKKLAEFKKPTYKRDDSSKPPTT
jgi:type VI protein secretion system component VasK